LEKIFFGSMLSNGSYGGAIKVWHGVLSVIAI